MDEKIKIALGETIISDLKKLRTMPPGEQRTLLLGDILKLYELKLKETHIELESEEFQAKLDAEAAIKDKEVYGSTLALAEAQERLKKQERAEHIDKVLGYTLKAAEITDQVLGKVAYTGIVRDGFTFELENVVTSKTFKDHLSRGFQALFIK